MECLREKSVVTRKEHQCFACLRVFAPGTKMNASINASSDHGIYTIYTCLDCNRITPDLREDIEESDGIINEGCILEDFNYSDYDNWDDYYKSFDRGIIL